MTVEVQNALHEPTKEGHSGADRLERKRLIAHLGRVFTRRYDIKVIPSRQKGLWACSLDPKVSQEIRRYIEGERENLDDLPTNAFVPTQIIYDEPSAQDMPLEEITTLLHHEAGHAKYTDFKLMIEGQRQAKEEGHLPTSFWVTFEGIEDPRINSLEGEESPAIDRQIRTNQAKDLNERLTEKPLSTRPKMMQFAYDTFHVWLHDEPIPAELNVDADVAEATEKVLPLVKQYFANTDTEERHLLQQQIWDVAKELEAADIENEKKKQMARQMGKKEQGQQGQSQGQPGAASGQGQGGGEPQGQSAGSGSGDDGEIAPPAIPGGTEDGQPQMQQGQTGQPSSQGQGQGKEQQPNQRSEKGEKDDDKSRDNFLNKLRNKLFGPKGKGDDDKQGEGEIGEADDEREIDLSKLSAKDLREIQQAIENLTPEEFEELTKKARQSIDEKQKRALEKELSKTLKLRKNKKTGEYEAIPQLSSENEQRDAKQDYQKALEEVEAAEGEETARVERARQELEETLRRMDQERREKIEMQKAGFGEDERDKFLLYQALENSMYANTRNFRQAIERVIPRKKESRYESGYFSGPKFDRRELIKKAPLGNEQFWKRQVETPTGEPRLFIGLLVDNSQSMDGRKMEEARKTTIFFSKVCLDMGIPFMAASFGDEAELIKDFDQDFDDPSEGIKPKLLDATEAVGGYTNMHAGVEITIEAMNKERRRLPDCHGIIFVITDGGANRGLTGQQLRDYIDDNRGRLTFKAFGLSGNEGERQQIQAYLNLYFGESNCAYPQAFENLPDEAFRLLRTNLIQFQRFFA